MRRKTCAVSNCFSSSAFKNVSFFAIDKRCIVNKRQWLQIIRPPPTNTGNLFVCSDHFLQSDFKNPSCKWKGLREWAVPSLKLDKDPEEILNEENISVAENVEVGTSLGNTMEAAVVVPNNRGLKNKKRRSRESDHDYACTIAKYTDLLRTVKQLKNENKRLRTKTYSQSSALKRKTASILRWKQKAKNYRKGKIVSVNKLTDTLYIELQRNASRSRKGARYSKKLKTLALRVYYCSPRAYREMQSVFRLPCTSLIKKWLQRIKIEEGFSFNIQSLLRQKALTLSKSERVVSIIVDEMTLRPNLTYQGKSIPDVILGYPSKLPNKEQQTDAAASSVLVVMIKGVVIGFKQSVGYFFSKNGFKTDDLYTIILQAVDFVTEAGFFPKVLISDQNSTNRSLFKKLGVSVDKPYFRHNESNIYCLYDPPHLIKSTRNNLMRHNAIYREEVATWDHLKMLYDEDVKRIPRTAPKLTNKHLYLPAFGEMRVGVAVETLSASVAAAMKLYVGSALLPSECLSTAKFVEDFDKLFDCFNASSNTQKRNKVYLKPVTKNSHHWKYFEDAKKCLQDLRFVDKKCEKLEDEASCKALPKQSKKPWFVEGWLLDIESLKLLFEDLSETFGIEELLTRNLTQDCLENFFGVIRMKNATNNRPDVFSFKAAYRATVVNQLIHLSEKCNSEPDAGAGLLELNDFPKLEISTMESNIQPNDPVELNVSLEEFDSAQLDNIGYTAGWISSTITHDSCVKILETDTKFVGSTLAKLKNSKHQIVSEKLATFLTSIVAYFNENFQKLLKESPVGIKSRIMEHMLRKNDTEFLCNICMAGVCDRYINMLIKAKVKILNESGGSKRKQSNKIQKTGGREKAQKLNID